MNSQERVKMILKNVPVGHEVQFVNAPPGSMFQDLSSQKYYLRVGAKDDPKTWEWTEFHPDQQEGYQDELYNR